MSNTDNTKNAQAPIFPAEDAGTQSTQKREGNSEVFPRSKTHKDLEEQPRESQSIMRMTSPTSGAKVVGTSSEMFEKIYAGID